MIFVIKSEERRYNFWFGRIYSRKLGLTIFLNNEYRMSLAFLTQITK